MLKEVQGRRSKTRIKSLKFTKFTGICFLEPVLFLPIKVCLRPICQLKLKYYESVNCQTFVRFYTVDTSQPR